MNKEMNSLLEDYAQCWPEELVTVERFRDFVCSHSDYFSRDLEIGHITGSAWVVNQKGTHVLLTHHRKLNRWLQLGGHADGNPDVLAVALREVQEESGLENIEPLSTDIFDLDIHRIPARKEISEHFHYDVRFALKVTGDEQYVVSEESYDLSWIEISNMDKFSDDQSLLRMAHKWKSRSTWQTQWQSDFPPSHV